MDKLTEDLSLEILSRVNDSTVEARCQVALKTFRDVYPHLRSINLLYTWDWHIKSRFSVFNSYNSSSSSSSSSSSNSSQIITPFKVVFGNLLSRLRVVESVCIGIDKQLLEAPAYRKEAGDLYLTDGDFIKTWLPSVSLQLKSLSITDFLVHKGSKNALEIISTYCENLVELELKNAQLSVATLNPMPMLTTLTLEYISYLYNADLNRLNNCFPNLQVLNLKLVDACHLDFSNIRFLNLKTCHLDISKAQSFLTIVMPNLVTLRLECKSIDALYVEAPMLSHFHLALDHPHAFEVLMHKKLKTLSLKSLRIDSVLSKFSGKNYVANLTLDMGTLPRGHSGKTKLTLGKVFSVFPNLSCLCMKSSALMELKRSFNYKKGRQIPSRWKGLKTFCAHLLLVDPTLTLSRVAIVVDECIRLSEVLLFIHHDHVDGNVSMKFMSRCMARWPGLKWRWGMWKEGMKDCWLSYPPN